MLGPILRRCLDKEVSLLGDEEPMTKAKAANLVQSESAPASHVFSAARVILGDEFVAWEPESVWMGFKDKGLEIPDANRDKILALGTLIQVPGFYWDANLFEDTCLAFNSEPVLVDVVQEASPAQIAWGVFEAQAICTALGSEAYQFDHEPRQYTAVSLHHDGLVLAPPLLVYCQDELNALNTTDDDFYDEVRNRWEGIQRADTPLLDLELKETPSDTQIAKLAAITLYLEDRAERFLSV